MNWTDLPAETNYYIEWSNYADFHLLAGNGVAPPNATSYVAAGLATGATYYFRVRAGNGSRCYGPYSDVRSAVPDGACTPPGAPTLHRLAVGPARTLIATWDAASSAAFFDVQWALTNSFATLVGETLVSGATTVDTIRGLDAGTPYYVRVRGEMSDSCVGPWSGNESAIPSTGIGDTGQVTGDRELRTSRALYVHPNPAQDRLIVDGLRADEPVRVTDVLGRDVSAPRVGADALDVRALPSGLYWARVGEGARGDRVGRFRVAR